MPAWLRFLNTEFIEVIFRDLLATRVVRVVSPHRACTRVGRFLAVVVGRPAVVVVVTMCGSDCAGAGAGGAGSISYAFAVVLGADGSRRLKWL